MFIYIYMSESLYTRNQHSIVNHYTSIVKNVKKNISPQQHNEEDTIFVYVVVILTAGETETWSP